MVTSASHATTVAGPARAASGRPDAEGGRSNRRLLAAVAALTILAAVLRVTFAQQSLFGDELSTWWIVTTNDLDGVLSIIHDRIEITPPLYFVLAELVTQVDESPEWLRAPSLLVGTSTVPIVYALGARTVGRPAGLAAATLTAFAPFMIFYGSEARGYQLMTVLVMLSTLALLAAVESGRKRWWAAYAACSVAAAYSHYTCVFALAAQLAWVLWAHPEARRAALVANAAAAVAFLPWLSGFVDDLNMPDSRIMSEASPLTWHTARLAVEHWSVGYPYIVSTSELRDIPGIPGLALQALGLAIGIAGAAVAALRRRRATGRLPHVGRRVLLVVALALSAPVLEAAATLFGTNLIAARNLSVSWPWFALTLATILVAAGPRLRFLAAGLVIAGFAIGAAKMTQDDFGRPDFAGAAAIIDAEAGPRDGVVDAAVAFITPGPLTGLDAALERRHRILRGGAPQHRDGNFRVGDPILAHDEVIRRAAAAGGRVFVVYPEDELTPSARLWDPLVEQAAPGYERVRTRILPGFIPLAVHTYAP